MGTQKAEPLQGTHVGGIALEVDLPDHSVAHPRPATAYKSHCIGPKGNKLHVIGLCEYNDDSQAVSFDF